jgi:hypothetical protein
MFVLCVCVCKKERERDREREREVVGGERGKRQRSRQNL